MVVGRLELMSVNKHRRRTADPKLELDVKHARQRI